MNNMGPYGTAKNAPWTRGGGGGGGGGGAPNLVGQTNALQQQIISQGGLSSMNTSGIVPFQQQQVFQNVGMQQQNLGLGLQQMANPAVGLGTQLTSNQLFQQVGAVTYPSPRNLNASAFQSQQSVNSVPQSANNTSTKQRFFTGTVTTVHDNFGFVDEDVFFQTTACGKGQRTPMVGDRVLVEASYNSTMPFKWNATRIQVLPMGNPPAPSRNNSNKSFNTNQSSNNSYNAVPPPNEGSNGNFNRSRPKAAAGGRGRERSRDRERDDEEIDRKKRREERLREREKDDKKSPLRRRSRSPKNRRRSRIVPRYMVQIPKIALDLVSADVLETRHRYSNLYIPSDFFCSQFRWMDAFPADKPFTLNKPCSFHIMHKDVDPVLENESVLEPPDADYLFSAKVMLMSVPGMDEMYQKCCAMAEDKDRRDRDSEERDYIHPTRLINFLVGLRGKNETMAIGGPWSASLDGENPDKDPSVLIKTAIRTCKALTGIDLSNCTKWYRFVELYYRRGDSSHKGRPMAARVETVVLFLPDVWSCLATRLEWDSLQLNYSKQLERKLTRAADQEPPDEAHLSDEKEEEVSNENKLEPTHYSQLDPKSMGIMEMRKELKARSINCVGLIKSQLVAKLNKAIKSESAKSDDGKEVNEDEACEEKKNEEEEKKIDAKEKQQLEKRYNLPEQQHIIVHPSRTAKSGKFDCTVMSLSLLLDYRPEDTKEHSFEVSLFAELFNEMLMRDFGFNIYRALYELPDKPRDKEDKKANKKDDDKKRDDDDKGKDDKKNEDRKSVDKKKKEENESEEDELDDDEDKDKKKEKKKKERVKMFTKDKHLLLSFIYFDQTHCGYIFEKDIEDLLYTLGLNLSRAQVRKLVGKVITRDSLHYRKLTDKPKDEGFIVIDDTDRESNIEELAVGNKMLLPIFNDGPRNKKLKLDSSEACTLDEGLVMFRGALVDVEKLMAQLERSDKARIDTETRMIDLKSENIKLLDKNNKCNANIKNLNTDLKDYKEKLKIAEDSLHRTNACAKLFQTTLVEILDKIDPVLNSTVNNTKEENVKKDEPKSRWEKDSKEVKIESIEIDSGEDKVESNSS
ncbi:PREDICTED: cell division cycle and apoptosis regulator protein 1-like [Nicrophorus vespilloides]|uniref:Cell division cycle and apoptosis regulator protein 1-like n=1 Tax=Nicrophorus vespilloides TaxID=110193 RepID=A0ABM1MLA1_NICVS|nr:PREDICTED: cell division cycle and apoptosis regulator protein 1-like [Nicrophorus vespilloides]